MAGDILLSWQSKTGFALAPASLAVIGACLCWGLDNNLTQKVSASDPFHVAALKGVIAGVVNLAITIFLGAPPVFGVALGGALAVGFFG